jgi:hypothetical protein
MNTLAKNIKNISEANNAFGSTYFPFFQFIKSTTNNSQHF